MNAPDPALAGPPCKVLHVVNSLDAGGMENGVVNMTRELSPLGFQVEIACLEREGAFASRLPSSSRTHVLGKTGGFSPRAAWQLNRLLSRWKPDVLHTHNLGPLIYSSLAALGGWSAPILHGEHSQLTDEERTPKRLRQRRWLYRSCRLIHCVSKGIQSELETLHFPASKLILTTNGVDASHFSPGDQVEARRQFGIPAEAFLVGIVGRFGPFKRHAALLDAFEQMAAAYPQLHLLIAGKGGSEQVATEERARQNRYADRIHLVGFQSDPASCYRALDLLVIPSTNEGLSNVALEAMASGAPVLGNLGCGHEQIISSGADGVLADLSSPDRLAHELGLLVANPAQLREYGNRAREKIVARFSISAMTATYATLYRRVAGHS